MSEVSYPQILAINRGNEQHYYLHMLLVFNKNLPGQMFFFSERKGLLSYMLARKRTRSWGVRSRPAAAGLDAEGKYGHGLWIDRLSYTMSLEKKDVS